MIAQAGRFCNLRQPGHEDGMHLSFLGGLVQSYKPPSPGASELPAMVPKRPRDRGSESIKNPRSELCRRSIKFRAHAKS